MKVKDFEELLEDLNDMSKIAERRNEEINSHKDLVKDLKRNDII